MRNKMLVYNSNLYLTERELYELNQDVDQDELRTISCDVFTLVGGRHDTPCQDSIYRKILSGSPDLFDFLECRAHCVLSHTETDKIVVYVTGYTPAVVALINVCRKLGKKLFLMHYDTKRYYYRCQVVL